MSDLWEYLVNLYHTRLVPTVKRMLDRRRLPYTLLTVGVLFVCVTALSLLLCSAMEELGALTGLEEEYNRHILQAQGGGRPSTIPEFSRLLARVRGERVAASLMLGALWLLLAIVALGRIMSSVMAAEAYVYGLFMIYGADRKQLSRQITMEFLLAGIPALTLGLVLGPLLHRIMGGSGRLPLSSLLPLVLAYLLLVLLCAGVLARRLLRKSCMALLRASDTAEVTVSPRRSHMGGLTRKRSSLASAGLAVWRMRRHYGALALTVCLVTATVFGMLTPVGSTAAEQGATFTLQFPKGLDSGTLSLTYLDPLLTSPHIKATYNAAADTATGLGLHILSDHNGIGGEGLALKDRYATNEFRIACGDGDTFHELGGNLVLPDNLENVIVPNELDFGYKMDAVPAGYAVYVYPEGTTPPLDLQVGDAVRLFLSADGRDLSGEAVTVRISQLVAVPHLRGERGGPVICPRITEDYLYLSPADYEKFCGETHAMGLVAEEAFVPDFFSEAPTEGEEGGQDSCILVIPKGNAPFSQEPSRITVILPEEPIKEPFRDGVSKESLPEDSEYFINHTSKGMGVYMGDKTAYLQDFDAAEALDKWRRQSLFDYVGDTLPVMAAVEYPVEQIIYTDGGAPYLILPNGEDVHFFSMDNDLCAFRLGLVDWNIPLMMKVTDESYLLETDSLLSASFLNRPCYVGTALSPDFAAVMKAEGLQLQLPVDSFRHTKTRVGNRFSLGNRSYLLTDNYPYEKDYPPQPRLQADYYPRVITGVGSFCHVGPTDTISILGAEEAGVYGVFEASSIGSLRENSITVPGQFAYNGWVVAPANERAELPAPEVGHAILILPDPETCPLRGGDVLSLSLRQDTSALAGDEGFMSLQMQGQDPLPYLLEKLKYDYMELTVDAVIRGDTPTLVVAERDLTTALGIEGIYRELEVSLSETPSVRAYAEVYGLLSRLAKGSGGQATLLYDAVSLIHSRVSPDGSAAVTRLTGILGCCILPLLLWAAQLVFYEKRGEEFRILNAVGVPRSKRRGQFALETLLTACLLGLCATLACPVGYLLRLMLGDLLGAPPPSEGFDLPFACVMAALTALSCLVAGLTSYIRMAREPRNRHNLREEETYEGSGM